MRKLLKLAWRDVWRNRRRSLITMGAIVFAVVIISLANSVQYGTYDAMEEISVRLFSGDLQVHRAGFQDERTFSYSLEEYEQDWAKCIDEQPWIEASSKRLSGFGLVSSDSSSAGAMILGIQPENERQVSTFANLAVEGTLLTPEDDHAVLLGETLARNLSVGVGDSVVVLTQGYRNAMGADLYVVKGLIRTGTGDVDRAMMIMALPDAQYLFSMEDRFTEIVLRTRDFRQAEGYAAALRERLPEDSYEVMPWKELMPELQQARALDDAGNYIFYMFLLLMVGFEIFNTTTMSMMERVREFGVMMSIGMKPRQVGLLVGLELAIKVALALAAGLLVTGVVVLFLKDNPIPLGSELQQLYEDFGFSIEGISFSARPVVFVYPLVSVTIVSLLAMVYPILKMRRFAPVEALRRV
ncbi:MAG: ABC transporter permease [Rhodothermales bacterium]